MAVKSSRSVFLMLRTLARATRPMSAGELSGALDLPMTTALRALATLEAAGYAERWQSSARYTLGEAARTLAFAFMAQFPMRDLALPYLQRLTLESGVTASVFVRLGWFAVRVATVPGRDMIGPGMPAGEARSLTSGAPSLAMLARLAPEEHDAALLHAGADDAARREVFAACAALAADGVLIAPSPVAPEASDIAVPLFDASGRVVAAAALEAAPRNRAEALAAPGGVMRAIIAELDAQSRREASGDAGYGHIRPDEIAL